MTASYRVRVLDTWEQWCAWLDVIPTQPAENPHAARVRHIEATGETVIRLHGSEFSWICPGCGIALGGTLGDQPVSGWDQPRWVLTGVPGKPTLAPSLGCSTWRRGDCIGHWWLRDGILSPA